MSKIKKKNKWVKFRHRVFFTILYPFVYCFCKIKYRVIVKKYKPQKGSNYFIIYNHQTFADHFFIPMVVRPKKLYFVATEDICSNGFISKLLNFVLAPIPMDKTSVGITTVMQCMSIVKDGGSICIAPEGNRTYSGKTEHIKASIVKLIKALKIPLMIVRIEGGFGLQPRFTDKIRKGKISAFVKEVIDPKDYIEMSDEELYKIVKEGLYVNEAKVDNAYKSNKKAEFLERVAYTCPYCGLTTWYSKGNYSTCLKCNRKIEYLEDKTIKGVGFDFPFKFMNDWYEYQNDFIRKADLSEYINKPLFVDRVKLFNVILKKNKTLISKKCVSKLFADKIELNYNGVIEIVNFADIDGMACLGRNKLSFKFKGKIYQYKVDKRFNPLKYMNIYYKSKNITEDNGNGIFLGL